MGNSFKANGHNLTAGQTGYLVANTTTAGTEITIIGCTMANTGTTDAVVSVYHYDNVALTTYYLVKEALVPAGASLVVIGGDQKVVLEYNQVLKAEVVSGDADAFASYLEIT